MYASSERYLRRGRRIQEQLPALDWVRESFVVDGVVVLADFLRLEDATSIFIRLDDCDIGIESYGVDLTGRRLVRAPSLQPFLSDVWDGNLTYDRYPCHSILQPHRVVTQITDG